MNNIIEDIEFIDGFWWPIKGGKSCRDYTLERKDVPQKISKHCSKFDTVISAGGNVGYYVSQYAKLFKNVYTFEPEYLNFVCLNLNVIERNVYKFQSFLGNKRGCFNLEMNESDSGGHNIGPDPSVGNIPTIRIDDLKLNNCDLIALDCEGFEREIIYSAIETILRHKPVVVAEVAWSNPSDILGELGYKKIDDIQGDWVYKYG